MFIFITKAYNPKINKEFNNEIKELQVNKNLKIYFLKVNKIIPLEKNILKAVNLIQNNKNITHIVFTSQNGSVLFFDFIYKNKLNNVIDILRTKEFLSVGNKTAQSIKKNGFDNISYPSKFLTSDLADLIININKNSSKKLYFLILRSKISNPELINKLKKAKVKFKQIHIYTLKPNNRFKKTKEYKILKILLKLKDNSNSYLYDYAIIEKNINKKEKIYLIFTSPSNSKTFFRYFKIEKLITNQKVKFLPIGPITAKEIQNYFKKYYRNKNIENINLNQKILKFPENYTLKDCILKIIK
jgi:uroporphyrinogen-III synthase